MKTNAGPPTLSKPVITLIWIVLLGVCTVLFNGLLDNINNPNKDLTITLNDAGNKEVVLERNRYGHYVASGEINNQPVEFLLDTGATLVAIPEHIAKQLNLNKGRAFQSQTANGSSQSYATTIDRVTLGGIVMTNVPASISSGMEFDEILLGMSFLKHLHLMQQGKQLRISVPD
ncbi:MAG: retroviral-like aspartic protease family protein [Pseudomonadota bacterium]|nr:retroviral-like aspartic protease family protein [Pseudomonadota bacterium]MDO7666952.1 retroviral-like aspartic protease family protein [Pseudomonadota bacterium]